MARSGRVFGVTAFAALVVGALWWLATDEGPETLRVGVPGSAQPGPSARVGGLAPLAEEAGDDSAQRGAERVPQIAPLHPTGPLDLTVRHAHGAPAAGAMVGMYSMDDVLLAQGALDDAGRWRPPVHDGPVEIWVVGVSSTPGFLHLVTGHGEHELVLGSGLVVEGRVLLDGKPPRRPFPICITRTASRHGLPNKGSDLAYPDLPGEGFNEFRTLYTRADGRFSVSGLRPYEPIEVTGPGGRYHVDEESSTAFPVRPPHTGIVLALSSAPTPSKPVVRGRFLRGRVLREDGQPAVDAEVHVAFWFSLGPPRSDRARAAFDFDSARVPVSNTTGRFAVEIPNEVEIECFDELSKEPRPFDDCGPVFVRVDLEAASARDGRAVREIESVDPSRDVDVGDLVLSGAGEIRLRVLDSEGEPADSVHIDTITSGEDRRSRFELGELYDEEGRFRVPRHLVRSGALFVIAEGHSIERVEVPDTPRDVDIEVRLRRCASVFIDVTPPEGAEHYGFWWLELSGSKPFFEDTAILGRRNSDDTPRLVPHGSRALRSAGRRLGAEVVVDVHSQGFFRRGGGGPNSMQVDGLQPNTRLRARLRANPTSGEGRGDEQERGLLLRDLGSFSLAPGEQRKIHVDLSSLDLDALGVELYGGRAVDYGRRGSSNR